MPSSVADGSQKYHHQTQNDKKRSNAKVQRASQTGFRDIERKSSQNKTRPFTKSNHNHLLLKNICI
jgi:hypothetical protein